MQNDPVAVLIGVAVVNRWECCQSMASDKEEIKKNSADR